MALDRPGWRATPRAFRPLPCQEVGIHLVAWRLKKARFPARIDRPAYEAAYRLETSDAFESVARRFGFRGTAGLAKANGLRSAKELRRGMVLALPGW